MTVAGLGYGNEDGIVRLFEALYVLVQQVNDGLPRSFAAPDRFFTAKRQAWNRFIRCAEPDCCMCVGSVAMKITHYLYNAFIIESGGKKIAIDPGALFFYFFRFTPLIPPSQWGSVTHILVTHGDPDHYWHADRMALASNAPLICNETMRRSIDGKALFLGPRDRGLAFTTEFKRYRTLVVGETIQFDGLSISGIKTTHGELVLKIGPFAKTIKPGPTERIGWGAIGFKIQLHGRTIVNLGDTLLQAEAWERINSPDVLMIPIGGKAIHNTMDEDEALQAVRIMRPKRVIPCHYNCPAFFTSKYNPADESRFSNEVEKTGAECIILHKAESITLDE